MKSDCIKGGNQPHFTHVWFQKYKMAASENQVNECRDTKLLFYIDGSALQQHVVHSLYSPGV